MIRVLLADDQRPRRASLRAALETEQGVQVVAEASSGLEAAALAHRADVVLLDVHFGDVLPGVAATAAITARAGGPRVLVITPHEDVAEVAAAVAAGAVGCLVDGTSSSGVVAAVRAAARGEHHTTPAGRGRLDTAAANGPVARLSAREIEVLTAVATGASNRDVAATLFVSESAVKSHLSHAYGKLGVGTRKAAVAEARRQGLLDGEAS